MAQVPKPRYRVRAGSPNRAMTRDSFQNFTANLGIGTNNLQSGAGYGFNPITRNKLQLEWMYRGTWMVRQIVDSVADDMTRAKIQLDSDMPPDNMDALTKFLQESLVWERLNQVIKWGRLYGGAIGVMIVEGQNTATPLRLDTVGRNQFKGLLALDRWMLQPATDEYITDIGPDFGYPEYYQVAEGLEWAAGKLKKIHHSRVLRVVGVDLPYWQRIAENDWGMSVIEPVYDRLLAFDSATQGASQLVYRAHLRTLKVPQLRELIAMGGTVYQAVLEQIQMIRLLQSNEGITLLDSEDDFETYQYTFSGLSDVLIQFGQQLSGAVQIPLTRLFGQSPAGMNATGESDMRNYYDAIKAQQEALLRRPLTAILEMAHRSKFGLPLPEGTSFSFTPLWQLTDTEKSQIAAGVTQSIDQAFGAAMISRAIALKELRQSSRITGIWSNITDEDIQQAEDEPPPVPPGMALPGTDPNDPNADPNAPSPSQPAQFGNDPAAKTSPAGDPLAAFRRMHAGNVVKAAGRAVTGDSGALLPMAEVSGLNVIIETHAGGIRSGGNGMERWQTTMPADYGYIRGTASSEGPHEQMDCFVGTYPEAQYAYIIDQHHPDTREFDEHKVMLAYARQEDALDDYVQSFGDGRGAERVGNIRRVSLEQLKEWLAARPYGQLVDQ